MAPACGACRSYQSRSSMSARLLWALRNFSSSNATMASFGQSARRPIWSGFAKVPLSTHASTVLVVTRSVRASSAFVMSSNASSVRGTLYSWGVYAPRIDSRLAGTVAVQAAIRPSKEPAFSCPLRSHASGPSPLACDATRSRRSAPTTQEAQTARPLSPGRHRPLRKQRPATGALHLAHLRFRRGAV